MICPILRRVATTTMIAVATLGAALTVLAPAGDAQQPREAVVKANWELANKFGTQALNRINYSTALAAR